MSQKTIKRGMIKQMSPPPVSRARVRFKTIAIVSATPADFAVELEGALNALAEGGWSIQGMMDRGTGLVITAQKAEIPAPPLPSELHLTQPPSYPEQLEVVYWFLREGKMEEKSFPSLDLALVVLREHIEQTKEDIVPVSMTLLRTAQFDPVQDLEMLQQLAGKQR